MSRPVAVLALVALAACQNPFIPEGTIRIDPPAEYRTWWEASRGCVHRPEVRRFEDIRWYISPSPLVSSAGVEAAAMTVDGRNIYIQDIYQSVPWIVQHELVHAINGVPDHPRDPFVTCHLMTFQDQP